MGETLRTVPTGRGRYMACLVRWSQRLVSWVQRVALW